MVLLDFCLNIGIIEPPERKIFADKMRFKEFSPNLPLPLIGNQLYSLLSPR